MIPIKPLSQRDPQWARLTLGDSGLTVGDWGCTLTSCVMLAQAFGKNIPLVEVLNKMNGTPGAFSNGSLSWLAIAKVLGLDWGYRWETDADPTNRFERLKEFDGIAHIERLASWGIPTVCFVDTDHDAKPSHWVLYIGEGKVVDPWDGKVKPFSTFERLYGYAIFTGTPVLTGGKMAVMVGKANDIAQGRNVALNAKEILETVIRP